MDLVFEKLDDARNDWCVKKGGVYLLDLSYVDSIQEEERCDWESAVHLAAEQFNTKLEGDREAGHVLVGMHVLNRYYAAGSILHIGKYKVRDGLWMVEA